MPAEMQQDQGRWSRVTLSCGSEAIVQGSPLQVRNEFARSKDAIGKFREYRPEVGTNRELLIARDDVSLIREVL
jgi:hypothetical protein